ncbi:hypothetical protein CCP2SC5_1020011 [Azospirillaceae bacterium]
MLSDLNSADPCGNYLSIAIYLQIERGRVVWVVAFLCDIEIEIYDLHDLPPGFFSISLMASMNF